MRERDGMPSLADPDLVRLKCTLRAATKKAATWQPLPALASLLPLCP